MKKLYLFFISFFLLAGTEVYCQHTAGSTHSLTVWRSNPFDESVFIENSGQFSQEEQKAVAEKINYYTRKGSIYVYFTSEGIVFRQDSVYTEKTDKLGKDRDADDKESTQFLVKHEFTKMTWPGANTNPEIEVEEPANNYFTYGNPNDKTGKSGVRANAWKKLIYHNLYPGIDVEFYYPDQGGLKYTVVVHKGTDATVFKMQYSGNVRLEENNGNVAIGNSFTKFTDHAPSATTDDGNGHTQNIPAHFTVSGNTISVSLNSYDRKNTLTIDPWITSPAFAGNNQAFDIDVDLKGNIYAYGSIYPYQVDKFDNAGNLLWTYTSTFAYSFTPGFNFYGGMCVDGYSGSSFISEGYDANSSQLIKINTNGLQVATNIGNSNYQEIWRLVYNDCEQKGVMLGGGTTGNSFQIAMLDTTLATFNPTQIVITSHMDFSMLTLDNNGNCYVLDDVNDLVKAPLPSFSPQSFSVPSGYTFGELTQPTYIPSFGYPGAGGNGFNGLVTTSNYLYSYDGAILKKWNITTGAAIASVNIHNIPFTSGGLIVNNCGDIFLGIRDTIYEYDSTLVRINKFLLPDTVYDLKMNKNNNTIYACGSGFVCAVDINPSPISLSTTPPSSCSACDASATAMVNCGVTPYTYLWSNGETTQTATNLCAGIYNVKITDAYCPPTVDSAIVIVNGKNGYNASVIDTNPGCALHHGNITAYPLGGSSPYTYSWSNGETTQKDTGLTAGTYTCTITDNSGCKAFVSVTLINALPPVVSALPIADTLCVGSSIQITASGANYYNWVPPAGLSCTNCPNPIASPSVTTTYTVTGSDSGGCSNVATTTITVYPSPKPIISGKDSVCSGYVDTLQATGGAKYKWSNGATTSSINYNVVGTQTITVTAYSGICSHDTTFVIHAVKPAASIKISKDSICSGDSVQLTGSGGFRYKWSTGSTETTIWVKPAINKTYTLYAYEATCSDSATAKVTIIPPLSASITSNTDSICPNGTAVISISGNSKPVTYKWNTGATSSSITVHDNATTTYSVTVYGVCDTLQKIIQITVVPNPIPEISGTLSKCKGQKDTLSVTSSVNPVTYLWSNGKTSTTIITGGINADSTLYVTATNSMGCAATDTFHIKVMAYPTATITYPPGCGNSITTITANATGSGNITYHWNTGGTNDTIDVQVTKDTTQFTVIISNGCPIAKTVSVIKTYPDISACCNDTIYQGSDTTLTASGAGIVKYQWIPPTALNCDTCPNVIASPTTTTTYTVIATDTQGCQSERIVTVIVEIPCLNITIPNVFTPANSGALGLDNVFYIKTKNTDSWSLVIYDRWGKEMYNSTNPDQYWDGTTKGGGTAPAGVYYYILSGVCQGTTYKKDGFVQLIR